MRGILPGLAHVADFLEAADADVLVVGHTHLPMELSTPEASIVNPGSLFRKPPGGDLDIPAIGTFGVLELPLRAFRVYRVQDGVALPLPRTDGRRERPSR